MFRLSQFIREIFHPTPVRPRAAMPGPVVIWNLVRRCNLSCRHCYSISSDHDYPGELTTEEVYRVLGDLKAAHVPALILSGGEPMLRPDLWAIAVRAKLMGFSVSLSTNGTLIDEAAAELIAATGFDYVGISIDGIGATHDRFRGKVGAFDASLAGIRACRSYGLKVGLRFTMTRDNGAELAKIMALMEREGLSKLYLSHLSYAGRGHKNRGDDADRVATRAGLERLFDTALERERAGREHDFVTGNNDADGACFLDWTRRCFPEAADHIHAKLRQWGGNASGVNVANIDNQGWVHPDTMWWHERLGNVRERPFGDIWADPANPLLVGLRAHPRAVTGRCAGCRWLDICNGNSRVRAESVSGDVWAADPSCPLRDEEIAA